MPASTLCNIESKLKCLSILNIDSFPEGYVVSILERLMLRGSMDTVIFQ